MTKIFKYLVNDEMKVQPMPIGAQAVFFGRDPNDQLCVWARVDPEEHRTVSWFFIVGTGQSIPSSLDHVMSCVDGAHVWHLMKIKG